ncbi:hypothetical protein Sango_2683900 [Sesamum angolense]|uniref:Reverse transcriptase/retrotransposon-derived protein RNase H-like domain-containing protein n=1 Tax=Sesamum angolense TaxID=2727404 RepID=A0AAE1W2U2_9LAMI|nr:hypothetical protein Sango_2683900 [Sesamum angolense]
MVSLDASRQPSLDVGDLHKGFGASFWPLSTKIIAKLFVNWLNASFGAYALIQRLSFDFWVLSLALFPALGHPGYAPFSQFWLFSNSLGALPPTFFTTSLESFAPYSSPFSNGDQVLLLLADDDSLDDSPRPDPHLVSTSLVLPPPFPTALLDHSIPSLLEYFHLSSEAYAGSSSPCTLLLHALVLRHSFAVLVDSSSSHNIMQPRIASFLQLSIFDIPCFAVMGSTVTLIGELPSHPQQITFHHLLRLLSTDAIASCHATSITPQSPKSPSLSQSTTLDQLNSLTLTSKQTFVPYSPNSHIFSVLHGLPPVHQHDHHIHLIPGSHSINVHPYHYPHFQREAMAKLVTDMLQEGIIRPSTSPFSSVVLLVKKKDDSFAWTKETQLAFLTLKGAMTTILVLAIPNFSIPFDLMTDASSVAIGVVLS